MKKILFVLLLVAIIMSAGAIKSEAWEYGSDLPYTSDWMYNWDLYSWDGYYHAWEVYNYTTDKFYAQIMDPSGMPYIWYYAEPYCALFVCGYYVYYSYDGYYWYSYIY